MPTLPDMGLDGDLLQYAGLTIRDALGLDKTNAMEESPDDFVRHDMVRASLGYNANFNATAILARRQQYQVQVIASTFSSVSLLAALCAMYWFLMMRRNFRRDLVLMLICGDFWKSTWFLVFSTISLGRGAIQTSTPFCQSSGYFLQAGFEACDIAIFLMSLHMHLQIFPPKDSFLGHDGLYRIRRWVVAAWFIIPNFIASLAFVNHHHAFVSQAGFCSLPIRPYWYRLALSWIPRYLIWIYVFYVAISIYRHVGYEFKVFAEERDGSSSFGVTNSLSGTHHKLTPPQVSMARTQSTVSDAALAEKRAGDDQVAPEDDFIGPAPSGSPGDSASPKSTPFDNSRRQSVPSWASPFGSGGIEHMELFAGPRSKSNPSSRRGSRQVAGNIVVEDFAPPPPATLLERPRGSVSTVATMRSAGGQSSHEQPPQPGLDTITEHRTSSSTSTSTPENAATKALKQRRRAIQRQLRLLFIYPVVYVCLWVIPFVSHCQNYSNRLAQHPVFALTALNIFCQNIMGFADVVIFCWREKPWRHIPGSDGTFLGSFCFWRFAFNARFKAERRKSSAPFQEKRASSSESGLLNSIKRWSMSISGRGGATAAANNNNSPHESRASIPAATPKRSAPMHRRTHSGGGERRMMEAERAHERLQMERADYHAHRTSYNERRTSVISGNALQQEAQPSSPQRKEWWDRQGSIMDIDDDDSRDQ